MHRHHTVAFSLTAASGLAISLAFAAPVTAGSTLTLETSKANTETERDFLREFAAAELVSNDRIPFEFRHYADIFSGGGLAEQSENLNIAAALFGGGPPTDVFPGGGAVDGATAGPGAPGLLNLISGGGGLGGSSSSSGSSSAFQSGSSGGSGGGSGGGGGGSAGSSNGPAVNGGPDGGGSGPSGGSGGSGGGGGGGGGGGDDLLEFTGDPPLPEEDDDAIDDGQPIFAGDPMSGDGGEAGGNTATAPLPAPLWMGLVGLAGIGWLRRRNRLSDRPVI